MVDRTDRLWHMESYRLARSMGERAWADADHIRRRPLGYGIADQMLRAVHSIAANLAEGYSRSSGRDRVRLFEYALGSAREAIVWYIAAQHLLPADVMIARLDTLASIRNLLLATIPRERHRDIRRADGS